MVVKVQLYYLGSSRQRDDHQCGINFPVVADERAESAGLVGEQVVCAQYVFLAFWFGLCEIASTDEE